MDAPAYTVTTGCEIDVADEANIPAARQKIIACMTPPTAEQAEAWLVMLQAACPRRPDSEALATVAYHLYSGALKRFPADVSKSACERLARGRPGKTNWFPTFQELMDECERLAAPRQIMLASLSNWSPLPPAAPQQRTKEERERVRAMAREFAEQIKRAPEPPNVFHPAPTDAGGLTTEMRAHLARKDAAA